jgi:hypothetical protein
MGSVGRSPRAILFSLLHKPTLWLPLGPNPRTPPNPSLNPNPAFSTPATIPAPATKPAYSRTNAPGPSTLRRPRVDAFEPVYHLLR